MNISSIIRESLKLKQELLDNGSMLKRLKEVVVVTSDCYKNGGKTMFCGNGGSAADAQHLAAELSGRFYFDRKPLDAEALHVNTSYLTAVANDYSYNEIYSRLVEAKGKKGDILFAFSTSGNSPNVVKALEQAKLQGLITIGFTGMKPCKMDSLCDFIFKIPSADTPRIQEMHILLGHIICQGVEETLFAT
ncbi:MAG TPA: D-sedoheptulose 7-phosphate isomerase [Bacteroidales bacterium]|nr:D-sedoheptulose 7-phosphate isomerase [Bacteroidales bacterium]